MKPGWDVVSSLGRRRDEIAHEASCRRATFGPKGASKQRNARSAVSLKSRSIFLILTSTGLHRSCQPATQRLLARGMRGGAVARAAREGKKWRVPNLLEVLREEVVPSSAISKAHGTDILRSRAGTKNGMA